MQRPLLPALSAAALPSLLLVSVTASADINSRYSTTQHDFGGVGLLQTPTARMAEDGNLSFNANRTEPYSRYSISAQPLPWLEGTIRYITITNRKYGPEEFSGDQNYKDKAVDFKVRLLKESYWRPQIAFGMRDVGGTGLFSSEYFVANKRFYDLDVSLGIAWGYIGNRGDIANPLSIFGDNFNERPDVDNTTVGDLNGSSYFRGRPGIFGGIEYQTPWERLRLKVELDGNDSQSEPQDNNQEQDYPINFGATYRLGKNIDLTAALERGNTAMFGITYQANLKTNQNPKKYLDPAPEARRGLPAGVITSLDQLHPEIG